MKSFRSAENFNTNSPSLVSVNDSNAVPALLEQVHKHYFFEVCNCISGKDELPISDVKDIVKESFEELCEDFLSKNLKGYYINIRAAVKLWVSISQRKATIICEHRKGIKSVDDVKDCYVYDKESLIYTIRERFHALSGKLFYALFCVVIVY